MLFPYNAKNTFLEWAKKNKIDVDQTAFKAFKQYAMFGDLEPKTYYPYGVNAQDVEAYKGKKLVVPVDLLADDRATVRVASKAVMDNDVNMLWKFGFTFDFQEQAYRYSYSRPREDINNGLARDFLASNIKDYCVVIDRNTSKGYFLTTKTAFDDFQKWYADHLAELKDSKAKQESKLKEAYKALEQAQEVYKAECDKLKSLDHKLFYEGQHGELYKKM